MSIYLDIPSKLFLDKDTSIKSNQIDRDILLELVEFVDILNVENASLLSSFKNIDYTIELKPSITPLVGPIYLLSRGELDMLKEYIIDNLEKGRIRPL